NGTWTNISGATSASYSIASASASDAGLYEVVVTNSAGSLTSSAATLTVSSSSQTTTATFQQGVAGYTGTQDAGIDTQYAQCNGVLYTNQTSLLLGTDSSGSVFEGLLRFTNLGIPSNATVSSATLTLTIESWTGSATPITGYYVKNAWSNTDGTLGWLKRGGGQ